MGFCIGRDVAGKELLGGFGFQGCSQGGSRKIRFSSSSASLVLDGGRGGLVKANEVVPKELVEGKAMMALKSHSEAERRRRERINRHLTTLRGLVRCTAKMDKASLLAEVINSVRELKGNAEMLANGCLVPTDSDEVHVEYDGGGGSATGEERSCCYITVSICCDDRRQLWAELKQMMKNLQMKIVSAETSTLGSRVKTVFVVTPGEYIDEVKIRSSAKSIEQAMKSILERVASSDFSPRSSVVMNKKRRTSPFDSSSSSS